MTDIALRRVLARIDASYVEPGRVDARRMLDRALDLVRWSGPAAPLPEPEEGRGLVDRLAPALEQVLVGTRSGADERISRDRMRAILLDAVVRTLDPYSRVVTGRAKHRLMERFAGRVSGIGVRLGRRAGRIRVLRCHPRSPASAAGLVAGDVLSSIDGESVDGMLVGEALRRLRGEPGTEVVVAVERRADPFRIRRKPIPVPHVHGSMLEGGVGWIRIDRLNKTTASQFRRTLASLTRKANVSALALDLRGNKGGSMLAAAAVANRLIPRGVLIEALDRNDRPVPGLTHRVVASEGDRPGWPVAVLVDGATSSAAELLAASLAWNDRATLVGRRTFGKTTVMKLYRHDEADIVLRLAVAYMRAAGRRLSAEGLEPQVNVEGTSGAGAMQDPTLRAALRVLHGKVGG